jgi:non-ribosomal peptide synthetase component E (peptide arylation enzyme)
MDPIEKRELKRKAWMRLAAQRRRAGILRGRVVVMSLICFAVLWGVVFAQMATGNDPVLSGKEKAAATRTASTKQQIETTEPRELEPRRSRDDESGGDGEEVEAEPEAEEEAAQIELEAELEAEAVEFETEPLVTSQS